MKKLEDPRRLIREPVPEAGKQPDSPVIWEGRTEPTYKVETGEQVRAEFKGRNRWGSNRVGNREARFAQPKAQKGIHWKKWNAKTPV